MSRRVGTYGLHNKLKRLIVFAVVVIIAAVLGLTGAICFVDSARTADVEDASVASSSSSSTYSKITGNTLIERLQAGTMAVNDIIEYPFCNGAYSVRLPAGTYKFEVWGAQGGSGYGSSGGYGGYSVGGYTVTATTTVYIYVGGKGKAYNDSSAPRAGGYNGGGAGGAPGSGASTERGGAGGGGATDIRLNPTITSSNRLIIAGGGGGGGGGGGASGSYKTTGGAGGTGGGASGVKGDPGTNYTYNSTAVDGRGGGAATASAAGAAGAKGVAYVNANVASSTGSFYSGAGGGGGGGYYAGGGGGSGGVGISSGTATAGVAGVAGGGTASGVGGAGGAGIAPASGTFAGSGGGGGGGSGYIGKVANITIGETTTKATTAGQRSGDGFARIKILAVDSTALPTADHTVYSVTTNNSAVYTTDGTNLIRNKDVIEFAARVNYKFTLPAGYYKVELYGAQGGNTGSVTNVNRNQTKGGKGASSVAMIYLPSATVLYIAVGGEGSYGAQGSGSTCSATGHGHDGSTKGTYSLKAGGYNGGGKGGSSTTCSGLPGSHTWGMTGGGATHLALATGLLSTFASNQSQVIMVAGGGGGSGGTSNNGITECTTTNSKESLQNYSGGAGGAAGGSSGTSGSLANSTYTQLRGGVGGGATSSAGGVGGAAGGSYDPGSNDGTKYSGGGGGGGGGWYGGGGGGGGGRGQSGYSTKVGAAGTDGAFGVGGNGGKSASQAGSYSSSGGAGGGGGTSYIKTTSSSDSVQIYTGTINGVSVTKAMTGDVREGNGFARITVVGVTKNPEATASGGYTYSNYARGTNYNIDVSTIAKDPDGGSVYFTDGTVNDLDSYLGTGLYLDEACTKLANTYMTWSVVSNTRISINISKYPRSSDGYGQSDGTFNLYVKVRDSFGGTATRGYAVIPFHITVTAPRNTRSAVTLSAYNSNTANNVWLGNSGRTTASGSSASSIFNPNGTGRYTAQIKNTMRVSSSAADVVTIKASDLVTGLSSYDKVAIHLSNTTEITKADRTFKIQEYESGANRFSGYTSAGSTQVLYNQITIQGVKANSNYIVYPIQVWLLENTGVSKSNYQIPTSKVAALTVEIVLRVDNVRPVLNTTSNVIDVGVGSTASVSLSEARFYDYDAAITSSTHQITQVIVPTKEYVQLDKYGNVVSTLAKGGAASGKSYYNVAGGTMSAATLSTSAQSTVDTGFPTGIASTGNDANAFVKYSFSGITLTLTGLRHSFSMYKPERTSAAAYTGGTYSSPTTTASAVVNPGHFYLMLKVTDKNDQSDGGIWLPVAITVGANSTAPAPVAINTSIANSGQGTKTTMPSVSGAPGTVGYFAPMAVNIGSTSYAIGQYKNASGALTNSGLQGLAIDGDNFATSTGLSTWSGKYNEFLSITNADARSIINTVSESSNSHPKTNSTTSAENDFVRIEFIDIYVPYSAFIPAGSCLGFADCPIPAARVRWYGGPTGAGNLGMVDAGAGTTTETINGVAYAKTKGLKVTLKSATMNRCFYATVGIRDCTGLTVNIDIAFRVNNTAPVARADGDVAGFTLNSTSYSTYTSGSTPTLSYKIPVNTTFMVTPYDLITDADMTAEGKTAVSKFTLNGLSGGFSGTTFTTANSNGTAVNALYDKNTYTAAKITPFLNAIGTSSAEQKPTVKKVSTGTSGVNFTDGKTANAAVYGDRLFFVRTAGEGTDAYTFNPYGASNNTFSLTKTNFGTENSDGGFIKGTYINYAFGNTVNVSGTAYNLDFILFKSNSRTARPIEITLKVRDRYGAVSESKVWTIKIIIEVVNSAPIIKDASAIDMAATAVTESGKIIPTDTTFAVSSVMSDADGDSMVFDTGRGAIVANTPNLATIYPNLTSFTSVDAKYLTDDGTASGNLLSKYYASARTQSTINIAVHAIGSTKNLPNGLFVYFFVLDGYTGETLGRKQIEVRNTAPKLNTDEITGFKDPTWAIESTSGADITRMRYIVGSEHAAAMLKEKSTYSAVDASNNSVTSPLLAADANIRLIATDIDPLQGLILSQTTKTAYVNCASGGRLAAGVPSITKGTDQFPDTGGAAVVAYKTNTAHTSVGALWDDYAIDLLFYVDGVWKTRGAVLKELGDSTFTSGTATKYFDANGRWTVTDWAITLRATKAFADGEVLAVKISLRDEAKYGGDTAGLSTGYAANRSSARTTVAGKLTTIVYQTISGTGIRTKAEFAAYDNYYVVEDAQYSDRAYMPMTGGDAASAVRYSESTESNKNAAFRYPTTIDVPADNSTISVPMSYFGLPADIVSPDATSVARYQNYFVGYDIASAYSKGTIASIASAIEISDGINSWAGVNLNRNPYVTIAAVDYTASAAGKSFTPAYYNTLLSVPTIDSDNGSNRYVETGNKFIVNEDGKDRVLYLKSQETDLPEHNFGLTFTKNNTRTAHDLTLTVKLARSKNSGSNAVRFVESAEDARTVTVAVHIENDKFDLVTDSVLKYDDRQHTYYTDVNMKAQQIQSFALIRKRAAGDDEKQEEKGITASDYTAIPYTDKDYGTGTVYRDYAYFAGDSLQSLSYWTNDKSLPRAESGSALANTVQSASAQSSVLAYYGENSVSALATVSDGYQPNGGKYGTNNGVNGSGAEGYSSYFTASVSDGGRVINISSNRKTYINETALKSVAAELGLTWNDAAGTYGGLTQERLAQVYASRGLTVVYSTESTDADIIIDRVYYPLRVMLYDSCGAGWNEASYVAMEFRVEIVNSTPKLRGGNATTGEREIELSIQVGGSAAVNLSDYINDPDMYTLGDSGNKRIATKANFFDATSGAKGITAETGDYLRSLYADTAVNTSQEALIGGNGGLSHSRSKKNDVIMWMETPTVGDGVDVDSLLGVSTEPNNNVLHFTVNRRTTGADGKNINSFKFSVTFYDEHGKYDHDASTSRSPKLTFKINITNQAPYVTTNVRNLTMRAGDTFTVLTTYYDAFEGGVTGGSSAFNYSATKKNYASRGAKSSWNYADLTSDKVGGSAIRTDSTSDIGRNVHLGYIGLANDDTAWRLRIKSYSVVLDKNDDPNLKNKVSFTGLNTMRLETSEGSSAAEKADTTYYPLAVQVTAVSAVDNLRLAFELVDGEGGSIIYNELCITIVSSPPIALDPSDSEDNKLINAAGLEGVEGAAENSYVNATYRLFAIPSGPADVTINGFTDKKHASNKFTIPMTALAVDPDGKNETNGMSLFEGGSFAVNNEPLKTVGNTRVYTSDYFDIEVAANGRSFTLTATGYNPDSPYETLTFLIADAGKPVKDNTLFVTIRVYTVYSDMTNPTVTAMNKDVYNAYLGGSHEVKVKALDKYLATTGSAQDAMSTYAVVKLVGNNGTDGNDTSPVVDPDVKEAGVLRYGISLYAFIDGDGNSLAASVLSGLFARNTATGTFCLKDTDSVSEYLIGGLNVEGVEFGANNAARLAFVKKYVNFEFAFDGASVSFSPTTSTLKSKLIFYVEVQKRLGSRTFTRADGVMNAGSLFKLTVENSTPYAIDQDLADDKCNASFAGVKGDSTVLKIFDPNDPNGSLFNDYDVDDSVTIKGFDPNDTSNASYREALFDALKADPALDWAADGVKGKTRAVTVEIVDVKDAGADYTYKGLKITINRRIDKLVNDKYLPEVTFPMTFTGVDSMGAECKTVVNITIGNTETSAVFAYSHYDKNSNVGYTFKRGSDNEYTIDAQVLYSKDLTVMLTDFMDDADFEKGKDIDSFMFVSGKDVTPLEYLLDKRLDAYCYTNVEYNEKEKIATVDPISVDKWHYTGFTIKAASTKRDMTATAYIRIVDRATNAENEDTGVYITLNINVMNDKPFAKPEMDTTTEIMMGSDKEVPAAKDFFIGDYIDDNNESDITGAGSENSDTYLRFYNSTYLAADELYSTDTSGNGNFNTESDSSALFTLVIPPEVSVDGAEQLNTFNQWVRIQPRQGFYGRGSVEITVADGEMSTRADTLTATFRINVQIVYNPDEIAGLKGVSTARGKSTVISIETLIPDIENTIKEPTFEDEPIESGEPTGEDTTGTAVADENNSVRTMRPKNAAASFNPASSYVLLSVEPYVSSDPALDSTNYVDIKHEEDSAVWTLRALKITSEPKLVKVTYALKSDVTHPYEDTFAISVVENYKPTLIFNEITFKRYADADSADALTLLNTDNTVYLRADQIMTDPENDVLTYVSVKSQKPSLVTASLVNSDELLAIKFNARGNSKISVTVADETGESVVRTFTVINNDLPEPSFWVRIVSSFESNKIIWIVVAGCVLLALIVLIIVIAVARKRKIAREELEALLVSEMEIEEQMLRLAGAPSPTGYQSFGYLQSAPGQPAVDPNMLLGTGVSSPTQPMQALPPADNGGNDGFGPM